MPERNPLLAVGDTMTVNVPKDEGGYICFQIAYQASAVGFTGAIEVSADDGVSFVSAKVHDSAAGELGAEIATLTTDKQIGWLRNVGYTHARIRCTIFTTPGSGVKSRINVVNA